MRRVSVRFILKSLSEDEQRDLHVQVSRDLLEACRKDPNLIRNIITGDESCVGVRIVQK